MSSNWLLNAKNLITISPSVHISAHALATAALLRKFLPGSNCREKSDRQKQRGGDINFSFLLIILNSDSILYALFDTPDETKRKVRRPRIGLREVIRKEIKEVDTF